MLPAAAAAPPQPPGPPPIPDTSSSRLPKGAALLHRTSLPRLLKACAKRGALSHGRQLHALSYKLRLSSDLYVQTALLSMYSSCEQPDGALRVFDRMPHRNVVAWTAAIDACLRSDRPDAGVALFRRMLESGGVQPNRFALVSLLSACSHLGALGLGRAAHGYVEKAADVELTAVVGTSLVDMYCKCGALDDASQVFDVMPNGAKTVQCWNAMLHGFAVHGHGARGLQMFSSMDSMSGGVRPNELTFLALLCGCSHAGLVEEGRHCFDIMQKKYGIVPGVKHYSCMVDLLARAGLLDDALQVASTMPVKPNHVIWGSLLSACKTHKKLGLAEQVMERAVREGCPIGDTSHYVIMSNMYREAELMEKMVGMRMKVGRKPKGKSWIEVGPSVHEFQVRGNSAPSHPMWGDIRQMLHEMEEKAGKGRVVDLLDPHSEKIALAFGLLRVSGSAPVRISKNLRICEECHSMMKSVSRYYQREIIVRDCTRFHRFADGRCSCHDYW
uniref:Pentatricopeptide repeat-containing protein At2g02980 n=1 Tax=Anthurium amnicola TaxID=1678845 RepID=A0A1D1Y5C1_9ARAE